MSRRLVNFRGTKDFALIEVKRKPKAQRPNKGILWSSCETANGGAGKGVSGPNFKMQTAFGRTPTAEAQIELGSNLFGAGAVLSLTIAGAPIGIPLALAGAAIAIKGNMTKWVTFSKPCPMKDPLSFDEPTFEQFHGRIKQNEQAKMRSRSK